MTVNFDLHSPHWIQHRSEEVEHVAIGRTLTAQWPKASIWSKTEQCLRYEQYFTQFKYTYNYSLSIVHPAEINSPRYILFLTKLRNLFNWWWCYKLWGSVEVFSEGQCVLTGITNTIGFVHIAKFGFSSNTSLMTLPNVLYAFSFKNMLTVRWLDHVPGWETVTFPYAREPRSRWRHCATSRKSAEFIKFFKEF